MKKAMLHTKVSVRLRKSELRDEWYLYLEAYPVFKPGHDKPCREREYLNRIIELLCGTRLVLLVWMNTATNPISPNGT